MADTTCTYNEIQEGYDKTYQEYLALITEAELEDSTLAQYAGSKRLTVLMKDLESLMEDSERLKPSDKKELQSMIGATLYAVDVALSDANLFECDEAADFDDYV